MAKGRPLTVRIDGLAEMIRELDRAGGDFHSAFIEVLRGEVGDEILEEARARLSDYTRTGFTLSHLKKHDFGSGVTVGVLNQTKHPRSENANPMVIATWIESGTKMHELTPRKKQSMRLPSGRHIEHAIHPGTRAGRVMGTTLKVTQADAEAALLEHVDRILSKHMDSAKKGSA